MLLSWQMAGKQKQKQTSTVFLKVLSQNTTLSCFSAFTGQRRHLLKMCSLPTTGDDDSLCQVENISIIAFFHTQVCQVKAY